MEISIVRCQANHLDLGDGYTAYMASLDLSRISQEIAGAILQIRTGFTVKLLETESHDSDSYNFWIEHPDVNRNSPSIAEIDFLKNKIQKAGFHVYSIETVRPISIELTDRHLRYLKSRADERVNYFELQRQVFVDLANEIESSKHKFASIVSDK